MERFIRRYYKRIIHFCICSFAVLYLYSILDIIYPSKWSLMTASGITLILSVIKEKKDDNFNNYDILCSLGGIVNSVILIQMINE